MSQIGGVLLQALREARKLWVDYLPKDERRTMETEMANLGWDPFAYRLGDVERRTLATFINYLVDDGLITQRIPVEELFLMTE
ncbi:MAG: hypothetical protein GTO40_30680 [Deltaproteobacteria bacterium]|nr:hypothetical protein [Deltaproteobacteria bacterium]